MEFFTKTFTINLSGFTLTIFLLVELLFILSFLYSIARFIKSRLKPEHEIKTGFLGKKILSIVLVLSLVSVIVLGNYLSKQEIDYTSQAEYKIDLNIDFDISETQNADKSKAVDFYLTPFVEGKEWGNNKYNKFDVIWTISPSEQLKENGIKAVTRFEDGISQENPSHIQVSLLPGNYKVKALVTFNDKVYTKEIDVII